MRGFVRKSSKKGKVPTICCCVVVDKLGNYEMLRTFLFPFLFKTAPNSNQDFVGPKSIHAVLVVGCMVYSIHLIDLLSLTSIQQQLSQTVQYNELYVNTS